MRPAAAVNATKNPQTLSFSVRRYLLRRKERPVRRSVRREWGVPVSFNVTESGELPLLAELVSGSRFSLTFDILDRIPAERGPPPS
jgi:hypothetical protein